MCGEVSHAAVLCPSFYRAEIVSNPNAWDRLSRAAARSASSAALQRRIDRRLAATALADVLMTPTPSRSRSPSWPWAARAAACWPTGSSTWASPTATSRRPPRWPAWRSAPAPPSTTWSCSRAPRPRPPARAPVLALIPTPGDVDVVIASELMEAGRAMQRGLVTPDRTTLIASTHRVYAIAEKIGAGRRRGRQRRAGSRLPGCGTALHPLRHGRGGRAQRQRHQRGAVRRAVRVGHAALRPRGLRGHDPRGRCRRRGQSARLRRRPAAGPGAPTAGRPAGAARAGAAAAKPCAPGRRCAAEARCTASSAKPPGPGWAKACAAPSTTRTRPTARCTWSAWRASPPPATTH